MEAIFTAYALLVAMIAFLLFVAFDDDGQPPVL